MAAAAPAVMGVVSGVVGAAGARAQGQAAQDAANYNASVQQQQGQIALAQSEEEARRARVMAKKQIGGIRAGIGASGIQTEGSALDVLESSAANAELDAQTIKHQGKMKAWAATAGANLSLLEGQNAKLGSDFAAAGYLLKGGEAGASYASNKLGGKNA